MQACTLSIDASDPNDLTLGVQPWASYTVTAKCPVKKKKKKGKKPAKALVCHKTDTVKMSLRSISAGAFQTGAANLPYNERVTFTAVVTNAAGLHPAKPLVRSTTLHPPKKKPKPKTKTKSRHSKR
jgi:hypothetical protein